MTTQRDPAFVIDPRARAMLAEMGVRVWMPADALQPSKPVRAERVVADKSQTATLRQAQGERIIQDVQPILVRREPPLRLPVMDAPPVAALGEARYVIGNLPADTSSYDLVVLGEPCQGAAANLLVNLLKPLASAAPRIFVAHMVASHNDSVSLQDQLSTIPARFVLALGPHAAKALLDKASDGVPFSKLRGVVHQEKMVVTYHPQQLMRQPAAKAQAWADVKLALQVFKS